MYSIDRGFTRSGAYENSRDRGMASQKWCHRRTSQKISLENTKFYFWKKEQRHETDFVVKHGNMIKELSLVCTDPSQASTRERE
ncbi:MAG: hypothetical protein M1464_02555 [Candidatus Thermoplasmatota archaeon]|nr:hypothetical protein [Candidatus Thermoplasmatota archaeon]